MGNRIIWDKDKGHFYEVWYWTMVHPESDCAFWLRSTLHLPQKDNPERRGGLWLARFDRRDARNTVAINRFYPEKEVMIRPGVHDLQIGSSRFREGEYTGDFEQNGHKVSWNLTYAPHPLNLWLVPELVKKTGIPKADVCVPNVDVRIYGEIRVDEQTYAFDGVPAGQSHHWGYHYAKEWIWGHCNEFAERPGAWLEVLSVKMVDAGALQVPAVMFRLNTGSETYGAMNPVQLFAGRPAYADGRWRYVLGARSTRIEVEFEASPERFVLFPYESPFNEAYFCFNSCLCDCRVRLYRRKYGSWRQIDELVSHGRAAAEYCSPGDIAPDSYRFTSILKPEMIG